MKGLLPDLYRKQIRKSLISKWKRESPDKYTGYELNDNIGELYKLMKKIAEDQCLLRTIKAFYRVNKTLKDIIGTGSEYIKKIKDFKHQIVERLSFKSTPCANKIDSDKDDLKSSGQFSNER